MLLATVQPLFMFYNIPVVSFCKMVYLREHNALNNRQDSITRKINNKQPTENPARETGRITKEKRLRI